MTKKQQKSTIEKYFCSECGDFYNYEVEEDEIHAKFGCPECGMRLFTVKDGEIGEPNNSKQHRRTTKEKINVKRLPRKSPKRVVAPAKILWTLRYKKKKDEN